MGADERRTNTLCIWVEHWNLMCVPVHHSEEPTPGSVVLPKEQSVMAKRFTAQDQTEAADILTFLGITGDDQKAPLAQAGRNFRGGNGTVQEAVHAAVFTMVPESAKDEAPVADSTKKPTKAQAAKAAKLAAEQEATKAERKPSAPKRDLPPAPEGFESTYSNNGFVRYSRRLKANGACVTAFRTASASTPDQKKLVEGWTKDGIIGVFVLVNHNTGAIEAFDKWDVCYRRSVEMGNEPVTPIAPVAPAKPKRTRKPKTTPVVSDEVAPASEAAEEVAS